MGTPACKDCDGKRVYKSVDCQQSMYLHYHDYLLDGRWVLTPGLDDDDRTALVRNLGDGFDDEECPERESWRWEMRSTRAPGHLQIDLKLAILKTGNFLLNFKTAKS